MSSLTARAVDLCVPSPSGAFNFADPCTIVDDWSGKIVSVRGDARVRFASGAGDYLLRCEFVEAPGCFREVVARVILTAATDPCWDRELALTDAGLVNVDTGTIAVYDSQTIRSAVESYESMFNFHGRAGVLPAEKPAFFSFIPGYGDGGYPVTCDNPRAARIVVIDCI